VLSKADDFCALNRRISVISTDDKLAIHELLATASYGYDTRNLPLLESCLTEDAVMSLRVAQGDVVGPFEGRSNIMGLYSDSMASQSDVRKHVISNIVIAGEGERLSVTSILTLFATETGQTRLLSVGFYHDEVRRCEGSWRICKRHVDLDSAY